jgi:hypothetical protein
VSPSVSFESALSDLCENYEVDQVGLIDLFENGEYWHSLQILNTAAAERYCFFFLDSVNDGDEIDRLIRKIEKTTQGDWQVSNSSIEQRDGQWTLDIADNHSGASISLPEEGYLVGEEAVANILSYVNSLSLDGQVVTRGANSQDAYYLPRNLVSELSDLNILDAQGDPASEFY